MNTSVLITYWHDDDVDTITTVCFANDAEADKFEDFLNTIGYFVIERKSTATITADEVDKFEDFLTDNDYLVIAATITADEAIKNIQECLC